MPINNVISLTRKLISMDTVNPPGNEALIAKYAGSILSENGFETDYIDYGENRLHLVAKKNCSEGKIPIVFSGHFDTVPLGDAKWDMNPFSGEIKDGKIYGRGTSDMKGAVAAMIVAAVQATKEKPDASVGLIFTSGEETGCQGAAHLVEEYKTLKETKGIIIGEPTSNIPAIGHKGGIYLKVTAKGKTAHSSMPHLGDNAIYKAAEAVLKMRDYVFKNEKDPLLGMPTLNIGKFSGGINLNSVPDHAEFTIDVRTTANTNHSELLKDFRAILGSSLSVEKLVDLKAVTTREEAPFVKMVYSACGVSPNEKGFPKTMPYLTDGAVLQPALKNAPTIILGPGQPDMAHKTNEYCFVEKIEEAVKIYTEIILNGTN